MSVDTSGYPCPACQRTGVVELIAYPAVQIRCTHCGYRARVRGISTEEITD